MAAIPYSQSLGYLTEVKNKIWICEKKGTVGPVATSNFWITPLWETGRFKWWEMPTPQGNLFWCLISLLGICAVFFGIPDINLPLGLTSKLDLLFFSGNSPAPQCLYCYEVLKTDHSIRGAASLDAESFYISKVLGWKCSKIMFVRWGFHQQIQELGTHILFWDWKRQLFQTLWVLQ